MAVESLQALPKLEALPKLGALPKIEALPKITALPSFKKQNYQTQQSKNFYANYSDPLELNSFADAILNEQAIKNAAEGWGWFSWIKDIPILKNVAAAIDLTYNKGIKPALAGDWKAVGINALMNVGETLDIVANPIKGLLLEGGEGFLKGIGIGTEGRKNYDFDTGSWVLDIGLELITDPLNWISFGGKAAISAGAKAVTKEALTEVSEKAVKELASELSEKVGKELASELSEKALKAATKAASRTLVDITTEAIQELAEKQVKKLIKAGIKKTKKELMQQAVEEILDKRTKQISQTIINKLIKEVPEDATKKLLKDTTSELFQQVSKNIDEFVHAIQWDNLANKINKSVSLIYNTSERFQKFLMKAAFSTSGLGIGWKAVKLIGKGSSTFLNNTVLRNLRASKIIDADNVLDLFKYDTAKTLYNDSAKTAGMLNGQLIERTPETFYKLVQNQMNVDRTMLYQIASQTAGDFDAQINALERYVKQRYKGHSLIEYINLVKNIDDMENGAFKKYRAVLVDLQQQIKNRPVQMLRDGKMSRVKLTSLYSKDIVEKSIKNKEKVTQVIQKILQDKTIVDKEKAMVQYMSGQVYWQVKNNELITQLRLLDVPDLRPILQDINSAKEGSIGRLIENILQDPKSYLSKGETDVAVRKLKNVAQVTDEFERFFENILNTNIYPEIDGLSKDAFKRYLLDTLYSFGDKSASDVLANIDIISAELTSKIQWLANNTKTSKKVIQLDSTTTEIIKQQLKVYAERVYSIDATSKLFYTVDGDFISALQNVTKIMERSGFNVAREKECASAISDFLENIKATNAAGDVWTESFLKENAGTIAQESVTDVLKTLYDGLDGEFAYGVRKLLDARTLGEFFNFTEDAFYSVDILQQSADFARALEDVLGKIKPQYAEKFLTDHTTEIERMFKYVTDYIKELPNSGDLEFLKYLKDTDLDVTKKFGILELLYSKGQTEFEKQHLLRGIFNKADLKSYSSEFTRILRNPKQLSQTTVLFNPQNILHSAELTVFYDDMARAVENYNKISYKSEQIFNNFKNFTEALRATQEANNPLVLTNERYIKIGNNINNNILRYSENKIKGLWDQKAADNILEKLSKKEGLNPDILDLTKRFYSQDLLTDQEYKQLLDYFQGSEINIQTPFAKQIEYQQALSKATDAHNKNILTSFLTLTPEEMQTELAYRNRLVIFGKNDWVKDSKFQDVYKSFSRNTDLKKYGIEVFEDPDTNLVYVYLNKSVDVQANNGRYFINGRQLSRTHRKLDFSEFKETDEHLSRELNRYTDYLEELTGANPNTSTGDIMDESLLDTIYNGFSGKELEAQIAKAQKYGRAPIQYHTGLPKAVKNNLPSLEELKSNKFFEQYRFNETVLGSTATRQRIQVYTTNNVVGTVKNSIEQVGVHLQPKSEYVAGIVNSQFSIKEGIYKNFTDEEILEGLIKEPRYRLVTLKQDKKYGMKLIEIPALNVSAIAEARKLNAVIIPQSVFVSMNNVVNHRLGGSGFLKLWNRVMYVYKFGYLFNPGTVARNYLDTNLKTDLELGTEARGYKRQARELIRQYEDICQSIAKNNDGIITRKGIQEYFENVTTKIDQETFSMLDDFFRNGPVTNITESMRFKNNTSLLKGNPDLWRTFTDKTGKLMNWANQTEETNRLAIYLADSASGITKSEAWEHIAKTHFDYAYRSNVEQLIEMVFPFSTFAIRNIQYWVDTMLKHPEFASLFRDIYTPIWNFDDLTPEQLQSSWSLQYQIINGNIDLFNKNDTDYIARINPSLFDAFNSVVNPIQAVQNKLASPIQDVLSIITGEKEPSVEMLPVVGTIKQRVDKAIKEKNALPSLVTKRSSQPSPYMWVNRSLARYSTPAVYSIDPLRQIRQSIRNDTRIDPLAPIGKAAYTNRFLTTPVQRKLNKPQIRLNRPQSRLNQPRYALNKPAYNLQNSIYTGLRYQLRVDINKFR